MFSVRQYRTTAGSALRLRVDSRTTTSAVTVALPAAVARGVSLGRPAGRIRIVTASGGRQFSLRPAAGRRPGALSAAADRPGVSVRGGRIAITALPAGTGIVELTVYQPRPPLGPRVLAPGARANAVATVRGAAVRRLVARVARNS